MYLVITGTSRGIGLHLTELALSKGHHVLAVSRTLTKELTSLKNKYEKLKILNLDILSKDAVQKIGEEVVSWPYVDAVINNAGIYLDDNTVEDFTKTFLTNSIMPLFVTRGLMSKLKKSDRPVSLQITSQMGSIADNTSGGSYSYRSSKAALNMLFKGLSVDEKWLISLLVHPGWVQTDMGGSGAPVTPQDSAAGIFELLENARSEQSGTFLNYRGQSIHW